MTNASDRTDEIRATIKRLEDKIAQARSQRINASHPAPTVPSWAQPKVASTGMDESVPRLKARRKEATDFTDDWRRQAG
ncbi:MAG: hypothetical protein P8K80_05750 [Phycisphaerales bacterium]|jgi:hypothetical protein|nr:hypothetical protein [Phycisphaerales bacterium]